MIRDVCGSAMHTDDGKSVRNCLDLATAFKSYKATKPAEPLKWSDRSDLLPAEDCEDKRVKTAKAEESDEAADAEDGAPSDAGESKEADKPEPAAADGAASGAGEALDGEEEAGSKLMVRRDTVVEADGYAGIGKRDDPWMRDEDEEEYLAACGSDIDIEVVHKHAGEGEGAATARERDWMLSLTKRNLMNLYIRARWGWSDGEKRAELTDPDARYLIAYRKGEENGEGKRPLGFVHYRFIAQGAFPVLYLFEIQLERSIRRRGLGKHLMRMVEIIAKRTNMGWVMLTVFNENMSARKMYINSLGYVVDETSPSRLGKRGEHFQYEILSKCLIKHARHVRLRRSIPLHVAAEEEEKAKKRMEEDLANKRKEQEEAVLKAIELKKERDAKGTGAGSDAGTAAGGGGGQ